MTAPLEACSHSGPGRKIASQSATTDMVSIPYFILFARMKSQYQHQFSNCWLSAHPPSSTPVDWRYFFEPVHLLESEPRLGKFMRFRRMRLPSGMTAFGRCPEDPDCRSFKR